MSSLESGALATGAPNLPLVIAKRYGEVCPAPILHLHRHQDGYIAFATERDGDDFRPLVSIKASELETWFPMFRDQMLRNAFVGINADWRLRSYGEHGNSYGYPLHRSDRLRYINACYVDIDFHKLGLDLGTVIGRVINLQESGQMPHASMIVRSGHGVWLLWLVHDIEGLDISQRAFPDKLELYSRIQAAIIERLLPLGADMSARDAARHLRVPGSLNTGSESNVEWWIQGANESGYVYTLPQLAKLFKAIPTRRHRGELVAHNPAKRRGWVALNASRLRDFNTLRALRGGFSQGSRNNAAKVYAWLLRANAVPKSDVLGLLSILGEQCRPRLTKTEVKDAWRYTRLKWMRDQTISNWLKVTPEESELLERLPPAGAAAVPKPTHVSMAVIRGKAAIRRSAIWAIIAERGFVPDAREIASLLKSTRVACNHVTIWRDLLAIGAESEWTLTTKATKAKEREGQQPKLFSFPVCKG